MGDGTYPDARFVPLQPASRRRAIARAVVAPLLWVLALVLAAVVARRTDAIAYGLLIVAVSSLAAALVLSVLRAARNREERRYAQRR